MTCSPIPMPCRSLAVARSLLLSDPQASMAIAMCAVFVSSSSLTRFARLRSSRLFSSLLLLYTCSSRRACRMALGSGRCVVAEMRAVWLGGAMGDLMMRCVWRSVRCGTKDETKGGTRNAPFLSARFGCSHVVLARRGVLGELSAFSTVE